MHKILKILAAFLLVVSVDAANMTCDWSGTPTACSPINSNITAITQLNEIITVINAPFQPYIDNVTTSFLKSFPSGTIQYFPRRIFDIFVSIEIFNINYISSPELGTDSFYNCTKLRSISFVNNNITKIAARFASTCSVLRSFAAQRCNIQIIDENAFEGQTMLRVIDLQYNQISCIPPRLFQSYKELAQILLTSNKITALHPELIVGLPKLELLWGHLNPIGYIPNFNLSFTGNMSQTTSLDLLFKGTPILAIDPDFLSSASNTRVPDKTVRVQFDDYANAPNYTTCVKAGNLSPSWVSNLTNFVLGLAIDWRINDAFIANSTSCYSAFTPEMKASSLVTCGSVVTTTTTSTTLSTSTSISSSTTLANSGNGGQCATEKICRYYLDWNDHYTCVIDGADGTVTSITGTHYLNFADLNVTRVYFKNSYLSLVPKILFQKFPNLKFLHISSCGLNIINDKTFTECGVLELLDISDNDISRIDETALTKCTSLQIIDLSGNPINFVSQGMYEVDPALKRVHLRRLDDWTLAKRR